LHYRARVISEVSPEKVCTGKMENTDKLQWQFIFIIRYIMVLCVDYGNRQEVEYKDIVLLDHFDTAIAAVPPQVSVSASKVAWS